jgi:hypothetical protein
VHIGTRKLRDQFPWREGHVTIPGCPPATRQSFAGIDFCVKPCHYRTQTGLNRAESWKEKIGCSSTKTSAQLTACRRDVARYLKQD